MAAETTRGTRSRVGGWPCGAGHGVASFGGNDTANGTGGWDQPSRASHKAAAGAIALLDHLRLKGR